MNNSRGIIILKKLYGSLDQKLNYASIGI